MFEEEPWLKEQRPEHNWEAEYSLKKGDIYVEAGAFWCHYGRMASRKVGENGRVILIEPSPENIDAIKNVVKHFNLTNVTLVPKAVWSSKGNAEFVIYGNPSEHRVAMPSDKVNYAQQIIAVEIDTIDNILTELGVDHVDLLACDVEGAEVELVKGAEKYLNEGKILHVALGAYHDSMFLGKPPSTYAKQIMELLKAKNFKNLKYEGLRYEANESKFTTTGGIVYGQI